MAKLVCPDAVHLTGPLWATHDAKIVAVRFGSCVILGPLFFQWLDHDERRAVLCHESRHGYLHQVARGFVRLLFPCFLERIIRHQEFVADAFARQEGYADALVSALRKLDPHDRHCKNYPTTTERIGRLLV